MTTRDECLLRGNFHCLSAHLLRPDSNLLHMYTSIDKIFSGLLLLSILSTTYLYTYPFWLACAFPRPPPSRAPLGVWATFTERLGLFSTSPAPTDAPFRLLVLGDPQLEGDSSLLNSENGYFPSLRSLQPALLAPFSGQGLFAVIKCVVHDFVVFDIPKLLYSYRKRLDLLGNDYYLAHIYRTVHRFTKPTHVAVLGDLLGSQWVSDEEFERRGWRYWKRVFKHGRRVDDEVTSGVLREPLGEDKSWDTRVINIAGNHDIGYAGDITVDRLKRFERVFGKANWEMRFAVPARPDERNAAKPNEGAPVRPSEESSPSDNVTEPPELRIIVLNSLNLDTPAQSQELQADTYKFINDVISTSRSVEDRATLTLLLTHIPLHKVAGLCTDGPYFDFYSPERGGGVKEQNHLSESAAKGILEGIFGLHNNADGPGGGLGRNGVILTGHDHEGCDVYHFLPESHPDAPQLWTARPWDESGSFQNKSIAGRREITVRSMMGEFGGNAGLFSAWFDYDIEEWKTAYTTCALGMQHQWWAAHVLDSITAGLLLALLLYKGFSTRRRSRENGDNGEVVDCHRSTEDKTASQGTSGLIPSHSSFGVTTSTAHEPYISFLSADTRRRQSRTASQA